MSGITVGIDGSDHSIRALEWAAGEAAFRHAPLTVLTIHSLPQSGWTGNPIVLPGDSDDVRKAQQAAEEMTSKVISQRVLAGP